MKKVFLEISQNSQENTCARVSFLINLHAQANEFIKKETLTQVFSRPNHYAQLGNALQKYFFAYSALIIGTLKGSPGRFFSFSTQSQNFTGGSNGPEFALIFPYGQKSISTKRADMHFI